MGIWRSLRVAFVLGSLFMILLIIVYWDDVGGFNLYPLQDPKHESLHSDLTTSKSLPLAISRAQTGSSVASPTTAPSTNSPERSGAAAEEHTVKQEQREDEEREDEEKEGFAHHREQEARKQRIMDVCSGKDTVEFPGRTRAFEQVPNRELDHLIVDDKHRIIYCYVPKVQLCLYVWTCWL